MENSQFKRSINDNLSREHGFELLKIEGKIPVDIQGEFWQNGVGMLQIGGQQYAHLFEGDGAISCVRISNGEAFGGVRLIRTKELDEELEIGHRIYGFCNSENFISEKSRYKKNTANTNIYFLNGRLFATVQGYLPIEIEPQTLATLNVESWENSIIALSAHPHKVGRHNAMYNFAMRGSYCDIFAFPASGGVRKLVSVKLDQPRIVHDFILTEDYLIMIMPPLSLNQEIFSSNNSRFKELFVWNRNLSSLLLIVPLANPFDFTLQEIDPVTSWHFANGYVHGEEIIIDAAVYPDFDHFEALNINSNMTAPREKLSKLKRFRFSKQGRKLSSEIISDGLPIEFPTVLPNDYGRHYKHVFCASHFSLPPNTKPTVEKINVDSGSIDLFEFAEGEIVSEPVSVCSKFGNHYLLTTIYNKDKHQSYIALFESACLSKGPLARIWFDHHLPYRFHGFWREFVV